MNLILDKNEAKGRSLKAADTGIEAEKALREALVTGKVGALSVDPQYLMIKAPRGKSIINVYIIISTSTILVTETFFPHYFKLKLDCFFSYQCI